MFYKFYTLLGWFAKQELSQVIIILGCHHLEIGRSSKRVFFFFFWYIFNLIHYLELSNGLWKHLPVDLKFSVYYVIGRKI